MVEPHVSYHRDPDLFRAAIRYSAIATGFSERLIEKDYYCSLLLADLSASETGIVFKGGTCLSKVHADFYRLSEDLDFSVSISANATRGQRRKQVARFKTHLESIEDRANVFRIAEPFCGFNNSTQYSARLTYRSIATGQGEAVKVELSVREPVIEAPESLPVRTVLLDPFRRTAAIPSFRVTVLSVRETYAEKLRAALSRRTPAIRDFFDLDHALLTGIIRVDDNLLELLRAKLAVPGNDPVDMSPQKLDLLRKHLEPQLEPVLRDEDYDRFNLERAYQRVADIAIRLRD